MIFLGLKDWCSDKAKCCSLLVPNSVRVAAWRGYWRIVILFYDGQRNEVWKKRWVIRCNFERGKRRAPRVYDSSVDQKCKRRRAKRFQAREILRSWFIFQKAGAQSNGWTISKGRFSILDYMQRKGSPKEDTNRLSSNLGEFPGNEPWYWLPTFSPHNLNIQQRHSDSGHKSWDHAYHAGCQ